jgi:ElaB/YqjD/DUF883 family membrane-anchored ribosome-binding protein
MEPREQFDDRGVSSGTPGSFSRPEDHDTAETVASAAEKAKQVTSDAVKEAKERLNQVYERSSDAVTQAYYRAMDYSRENPRTATLVALGAGFTLGMLFAHGGRRDRRFLPAITATLADAVVDAFGRR